MYQVLLFKFRRHLCKGCIESMYPFSIESQKFEWEFGRTRNAVGTLAAGECFHSFFERYQTFRRVV